MSIVTPIPQQTLIKLYTSVNWDNTYTNVRLFDTAAQRDAYLAARVFDQGQYNTCSVVREKPNHIRLEGRIDDFANVSYMTFTNFGLGTIPETNSRTYYCFITAIDFVNVNTVELTFEIDWIQTYLFEFVIEAGMVEREHVNDDTIGLWLEDENIPIGEYVIRTYQEVIFPPAVLLYVVGDNTNTRIVNNVATCAYGYGYSFSHLDALNTVLESFNDTPEKIIAICMGVTDMLKYGGDLASDELVGFTEVWTVPKVKNFSNGGGTSGYVPHNNKLLCYPYMVLMVDNYMGDAEKLRWEQFQSQNNAEFDIFGTANPKPCISLSPKNYMGLRRPNFQSSTCDQFTLTYDNFPNIPYLTDTFKRWYSTEFPRAASNVGVSLVTAVGGAALGGIGGLGIAAGSLISGANKAYDLGLSYEEHVLHNRSIHGTIGEAGMSYYRNQVGFRCTGYAIRREVAERIDKIFDRYGYKVNIVKVPNLRGRQYVNYVKMTDPIVSGSSNLDARETLEKALKEGVSFWHVDEIGQELSNNPIVTT